MSAAVGGNNLLRDAEFYKVVRHRRRLVVALMLVAADNQPLELTFAIQTDGSLDSCLVEEVRTVVISAYRICAQQKGCVLRRNVVDVVERSSAGIGVYNDVTYAYRGSKHKR